MDEIPVAGIPLGMLGTNRPDAYEVRRLELVTGDILLLASDGLRDIRSEQNEFFGDRQLRQVLTELNGQEGSKVTQILIERALRFGGAQRCSDDVSIIAVTKTYAHLILSTFFDGITSQDVDSVLCRWRAFSLWQIV